MIDIKFNSTGRNGMDFDAYRLTQMVAVITLPPISTRKSEKIWKYIGDRRKSGSCFQLSNIANKKSIHSNTHKAKTKSRVF